MSVLNETFSPYVNEQIASLRVQAEKFADQGQRDHGTFEETDSSYILMNENDRISFKIQFWIRFQAELDKLKRYDADAMPQYLAAIEAERKLKDARDENLMHMELLQALKIAESATQEKMRIQNLSVLEANKRLAEMSVTPEENRRLKAVFATAKANFEPAWNGQLSFSLSARLVKIKQENHL